MSLSGRDIAVKALRERRGSPSVRLERILTEHSPPVRERALGREITLGCVRRRGTLRAVVRAYLRQPNRPLPTTVQAILHAAVYQVLFLDSAPDFAIVHQAVDQAKRFGQPRHTGLINGLLRTLLRELSPAAEDESPAADVVPAPNGGRKLSRAVFADPKENPMGYLASAFSLPEVLAGRWVEQWGFARARSIADCSCATPPVICRVDSRRTSVDEVIERLDRENVPAFAHENGVSVVLESAEGLTRTSVFGEGLIQPQDPTATSVVHAADLQPGMTVLDFCAAPGTKTTHLAERMNNTGRIVACDVSEAKLELIRDNCRRMQIDIVEPLPAGQVASLTMGGFDVVLVDVPCSNTGVLSRRVEARWRFDEAGLGKLASDQEFLLSTAGRFVKPGGQLIYSTCSIEPEENDRVVDRVLKKIRHVHLRKKQLSLPEGCRKLAAWKDGGFYAVLTT